MAVTAVYPRPRARRAAAAPAPTGAGQASGVAPPTPVLWPWVLQVNANERRTVVSPQYIGPAWVDELVIHTNADANRSLVDSLQVIASPDNSGAGVGVLGTPPTGTMLWDAISASTAGGFAVRAGSGYPLLFGLGAAAIHRQIPIGKIVQLSQFFLKVSVPNDSITGLQYSGHVRLIPALTQEQLENLVRAG